jgi:hypothetical protein
LNREAFPLMLEGYRLNRKPSNATGRLRGWARSVIGRGLMLQNATQEDKGAAKIKIPLDRIVVVR